MYSRSLILSRVDVGRPFATDEPPVVSVFAPSLTPHPLLGFASPYRYPRRCRRCRRFRQSKRHRFRCFRLLPNRRTLPPLADPPLAFPPLAVAPAEPPEAEGGSISP
jgi:hypothetical protein